MPDEPTDPMANGANEANESNNTEPQNSDANTLTGIEEPQIDLTEGFDITPEIRHLLEQFLASNAATGNINLPWGFNIQCPRPPVAASNNRAFQNYLIQMQILAGIPQNAIEQIPTGPPRPSRRGTGPVMLNLREEGCRIPHIPPVTFNGTLRPLFNRGNPNDGDSGDTISSDGSGSFEMPDRDDGIEVLMDMDTEEDGNRQQDGNPQEDENMQS